MIGSEYLLVVPIKQAVKLSKEGQDVKGNTGVVPIMSIDLHCESPEMRDMNESSDLSFVPSYDLSTLIKIRPSDISPKSHSVDVFQRLATAPTC